MPLFNMQPKDKKSPRKAEVRPSSVVIRVLPLLLCFAISVTLWCYIVGTGKPAEVPEATTDVETTEPVPAEDTTADPADTATETGDAADETEAQPADV